MHNFRSLTIGIAATIFLALAPATHAQSPDDLRTMQTFLDIMNSYFAIIESSYDINSNEEKAAIMQMQKIQEVYEDRGEKARVADILREVLAESHNPTIRNSAYMMLGDVLKETGRSDEAIEMLRRGLSENIKAAE
jgi:tetratricopeptide (TPR) repeat protein